MNVGIIGSGKVGSALGELWAAGHQVMFSFSNLQTLATRIGMNATGGTPAEAANFADVVFAPTFWLVQAIKLDLAGKIVIDTNPTAGLRRWRVLALETPGDPKQVLFTIRI